MLYCSRCQKMVDFNSVSESGPTRAYTLDLEGPVDPTIIRSSSKVVNICKTCGSKSLFQTKAAFNASVRRAAQKQSNENLAWKILGVATPAAAILGGIGIAKSFSEGTSEMSNWPFIDLFFFGFFTVGVMVGIFGALFIAFNDFN
jgi:hypothetical protein